VDYVGPAQLEWRANATFSVTGEIQVQVAAVDDGWLVRAVSMTRSDHWGLLVFDNPFVLRFPDGSCFDVGIGRPGPDGSFAVWDWSDRERHRPTCPACGGDIIRTIVYDGSGPDLSGPVTVAEICGTCGHEHHATYYLHGVGHQPAEEPPTTASSTTTTCPPAGRL